MKGLRAIWRMPCSWSLTRIRDPLLRISMHMAVFDSQPALMYTPTAGLFLQDTHAKDPQFIETAI